MHELHHVMGRYLDEKQQELARAEAKLIEMIEEYYNEAQEWARKGMQLQAALAEKLLLASAGALGVLSTLFATGASHIQQSDFFVPVIAFILSMVAAGIGLWSRSVAFFKSSAHSLYHSEHWAFLKAEAEKRLLGKPHDKKQPSSIKHPEFWLNLLDYAVVASGVTFIVGVAWTALNFAL